MSDQAYTVLAGLGGVALGGVISVVTQFLTQHLAWKVTVASERRQERVNLRREEVADVREFLDVAARADASSLVLIIEKMAQQRDSAGIFDHVSRERVRELLLEQIGTDEDVLRAFYAAAAASPNQEMMSQLMDVWSRVGASSEDATASLESLESLRDQIQRARELVEEYILGAISE